MGLQPTWNGSLSQLDDKASGHAFMNTIKKWTHQQESSTKPCIQETSILQLTNL